MRDKLMELWRQRPFKPFKLKMADGHTYVVRRPEGFIVLKSMFYLSFPSRDRFILPDIDQITEIQMAPPRKARK